MTPFIESHTIEVPGNENFFFFFLGHLWVCMTFRREHIKLKTVAYLLCQVLTYKKKGFPWQPLDSHNSVEPLP